MDIVKILSLLVFSLLAILLNGCDKDVPTLFSLEDEQSIGSTFSEAINSDSTFIVLDEAAYPASYAYADQVLQSVVNAISEDSIYLLENHEKFDWRVWILRDSEMHAFAVPGGHLYVTTGMVKTLERADQFAGLLAHLASHVDDRGLTKYLLNRFSSPALQEVANGENVSARASMIDYLSSANGITFSAYDERVADDQSTRYLAGSLYSCNGGKDMLDRLIRQQQQAIVPKFLVIHPVTPNRVELLTAYIETLECDQTPLVESGFKFKDFQNSLPK